MPCKILRVLGGWGGIYINVSRLKKLHQPIFNLSSTQKDIPQLKAGDNRCLSKSMRWHLSTCVHTHNSLHCGLSQDNPFLKASAEAAGIFMITSCKMKAPRYNPGQSCCFKLRTRQNNLTVHCGELMNISEVEEADKLCSHI